MAAWYGPLVAGLILRFGINISKNGLRTKYSDLFDEKSIGVLPKYITDHGMIECNDKIIEVTNLNHVSKNLYQQIGNHPVFRFLSKDIPDIYFQCTLSHPYAKEYSIMILGTASNESIKLDLLKQAIVRYLPNRAYDTEAKSAENKLVHDFFSSVKKTKNKTKIEEFLAYSEAIDLNDTSLPMYSVMECLQQTDALIFWKNKFMQSNFPEIAALNRILLCIDVSSAITESIFSVVGDTISSSRASMDPESIGKITALRYASRLSRKSNRETSKKRGINELNDESSHE